jgi:hypothetical protein
VLNYKGTFERLNKINCDLSRVCEVEDHVCEWYDQQFFYKQLPQVDLKHIRKYFDIVKFECATSDGTILKLQLLASKIGTLRD